MPRCISPLLLAAALLLAATSASAQYATAGPNYYPPGYAGDMFSGTITNVNPAAATLTLSFVDHRKTETFTGVIPRGFKARDPKGVLREVPITIFHPGMRAQVYFFKRQRENEIFLLVIGRSVIMNAKYGPLLTFMGF